MTRKDYVKLAQVLAETKPRGNYVDIHVHTLLVVWEDIRYVIVVMLSDNNRFNKQKFIDVYNNYKPNV